MQQLLLLICRAAAARWLGEPPLPRTGCSLNSSPLLLCLSSPAATMVPPV